MNTSQPPEMNQVDDILDKHLMDIKAGHSHLIKAQLLQLVLEVLPEKSEPIYGDGWDEWSEGNLNGTNNTIDEIKANIIKAFGVEHPELLQKEKK